MNTDVREEKLLVTSDAHIGSLFCDARSGLIRFLEYARAHGYNVCINGDGIDVEYTTLREFTQRGDLAHFLLSETTTPKHPRLAPYVG